MGKLGSFTINIFLPYTFADGQMNHIVLNCSCRFAARLYYYLFEKFDIFAAVREYYALGVKIDNLTKSHE